MGRAITNTYLYSSAAILLVVVIGVIIAYTSVRKKNKLTNILMSFRCFRILSRSVLGISLILAFNKRLPPLSGTAVIIIMAYVIRRLPYTIRSSSAILRQIDLGVEEASQSLGANPIKTFFSVTSPLMASGILSGATMSWLSIISELRFRHVVGDLDADALDCHLFSGHGWQLRRGFRLVQHSDSDNNRGSVCCSLKSRGSVKLSSKPLL